MVFNQPTTLYISGAINDNSISEVYAGDEPSKIIIFEDKKGIGMQLVQTKDVEIWIIKDDGSKEIIKEINHEELQSK